MGENLLPCNAAARLQAPGDEHRFQSEKAAQRLMANVINFYVPKHFQRKVKWVPPQKRGKLIEFCIQVKKSA